MTMKTKVQSLVLAVAAAVAIALSARANPDLYNASANSTSCFQLGGTIPVSVFTKNLSGGTLTDVKLNVCSPLQLFGVTGGSANQPAGNGSSVHGTCSLGLATTVTVPGSWPTGVTNSYFLAFGAPTNNNQPSIPIQIAISDATDPPVTTGLSIPACVVCNPPLTIDPPSGTLQPRKPGQLDSLSFTAHGDTGQIDVQISGGPPGMSASAYPAEIGGPLVGTFSVSLPPDLPPGDYTFTVTVTDARGCKATATYSFTVVGPGAGCVIQLHATDLVQSRVGSTSSLTFTASNIGGAPCTGPFTFTAGPGLPTVSTTPGSAFTMTGHSGSTGQQFSGTGTIPPGGFAGVGTSVQALNPGVTETPITIHFTSGPTQTQEDTVELIIQEFGKRYSATRTTPGQPRQLHGRP